MTPDRWKETKAMIKEAFEVVYDETEELEDSPGTAEVLEFEGPSGYTRVEFVDKPKWMGRKVTASARAGSESREEMVHSDTQNVNYLQVFVMDEETEEWNEVKEDMFS